MDKENVTCYTQWNSTQPEKKTERVPFATTYMDLEILILNEANLTKTDKCHMISLICGI